MKTLTKVDLLNVAKGIVEWEIDEGQEQTGRYGVVRVRLQDFLNEQDIEMEDQEFEDAENELYDLLPDVRRAAQRAVENLLSDQAKEQELQHLMALWLKLARTNILVIDDMEEMTRISLKWSKPNA
jgi:hypothetical protein